MYFITIIRCIQLRLKKKPNFSARQVIYKMGKHPYYDGRFILVFIIFENSKLFSRLVSEFRESFTRLLVNLPADF